MPKVGTGQRAKQLRASPRRLVDERLRMDPLISAEYQPRDPLAYVAILRLPLTFARVLDSSTLKIGGYAQDELLNTPVCAAISAVLNWTSNG